MAQNAKRYERIDEEEMAEFLPDVAEEVEVRNTEEKVYELPLPSDDLSIRVFTTLQDGQGRDLGADAIRTVIWSETADGPIGGEKKTLRIQTWRKNLREKIENLYSNWRNWDHGECPECENGVLCEREGQYGKFLACSEWNGGRGCEHTENL